MINEIEYSEIFSDETLSKLKTLSKENLRQVGSAFSNMKKTINLLSEIRELERPHRRELESLAEVIVRETYGITVDNNIVIRGRIVDDVDLSGTNPPEKEDDENEVPEVEMPEEAKRRIINSITQGGGVRGSFLFLMFSEHIDELSPGLGDKYNSLLKNVFGVYDDEQALAMLQTKIAQNQNEGGGEVNIDYEEDKDRYIINAVGLTFSMLLHEIIKGLHEIVALEGFSYDIERNKQLIKKVDKLSNEPEDLRYGKYIYDSINNFVNSLYTGDDTRIRDYFLAEMYKLESEEFLSMVENIINDNLSNDQLSWSRNTIREIENDLKKDDTGMAGLDYNPDEDDDEDLVV